LRPSLAFERLEPTERVTLGEMRGRAVVLNFFASWCTPCIREMPLLDELADGAPAGVLVLGLGVNDRRDEIRRLVDRLGVSYPTGHDSTGEVLEAAGVLHLPTTIVIDPDGRIVAVHRGEANRRELAAMLTSAEGSAAPDSHR
jgi:thiol-disulfide isomerase/thioredoxin